MGVGSTAGKIARTFDRTFGIREWLRGEPRPPKGGFDLAGEKIIDWGWICVNLPVGRKRALEIGCGESPVIPAMLARGYEVVGMDFDRKISTQLSGFTFVQGDFNTVELAPGFDVIVACSAIEHFGLSGRYGSGEDESGDLKAMRRIRSLLAPAGVVLLTVPVGADMVLRPWHRVYGTQRLPLLLDGFRIVQSRFLIKQPWGPWRESTKDVALGQPPDIRRYALGELMLCAAEPYR
jgi:SAM-dependent methyltransferase